MRPALPALCGLILLLGSGCLPDAEGDAPPPQEISREQSGYYCGMIVADHPGPKGQIFVGDAAQPIWFPSVRDAIAFLMLPGEQKNVRAMYVNDMARAGSWAAPAPGTWVDAQEAWYVLDSGKRGGMGLAEAVPFGTRGDAEAFIETHGGRLARLSEIPTSYIFDTVESDPPTGDGGQS